MQGAMSAIAMRSPRSSRPSSDRSSFRGYWAADNGAWVLHGRIQEEFGHVPKCVRSRSPGLGVMLMLPHTCPSLHRLTSLVSSPRLVVTRDPRNKRKRPLSHRFAEGLGTSTRRALSSPQKRIARRQSVHAQKEDGYEDACEVDGTRARADHAPDRAVGVREAAAGHRRFSRAVAVRRRGAGYDPITTHQAISRCRGRA